MPFTLRLFFDKVQRIAFIAISYVLQSLNVSRMFFFIKGAWFNNMKTIMPSQKNFFIWKCN